MSAKKLNILDCTLRDGGYYTNWDFDASLVTDYLDAVAEADIDFIELGLRQFKDDRFLGANAYTTAEYLDHLILPEGPTYGAMIDAKTILSENESQESCVDRLFRNSIDEKIGLVRVAAHFNEVEFCLPMLNRLKDKGYIVGLNIMQASLRSGSELEKLSSLIADWASVDVIYFADSLGVMTRSDMEKVYHGLRKSWFRDIGFHAHNNMGQAISNVNTAIDLGCNWIDCTVTGMGRGAGNAETEFLLMEKKTGNPERKLGKIYSLVTKHFEAAKKSSGWGVSLPYYVGALNGLHPSYVQELCADRSVDSLVIPKILEDLGRTANPNTFNEKVLEDAKSKTVSQKLEVEGMVVPKFLKGRETLLVAQTESSFKYRYAIADYAKKKNALMISINFPSITDGLDFDYVAVSHNEKFRADENKYRSSNYSFIAPRKLFSGIEIDIAYDYGIILKENQFKNSGNYACVPFRLTLAYAIAFCLDAGCESINLAGFSGFDYDDPRQKQMQSFLSILLREGIHLRSLTPTSFSITERSIYAI